MTTDPAPATPTTPSTQPSPRPSTQVRRELGLFLGITYIIALTIALALPHADVAPLLTIFVPVLAVAISTMTVVPRGRRRAAWREIGFGPPRGRAVLLAIVMPTAIVALSFGIAAAIGVVTISAPDDLGRTVLNACLTIILFTLILLGEEIGWRGFLLPRLRALVPARRAALLTGACHAGFHLPLLTLTTTYQSAGSRWIVVPTVMLTITLAGVWYSWLRMRFHSIWPVSLSHSAFNTITETAAAAATASSPAVMAYTTTETGLATMLIVLALAGYLLTRRASDFDPQPHPRAVR